MMPRHIFVYLLLTACFLEVRGAGMVVDSTMIPMENEKTLECVNLLYAEDSSMKITSLHNVTQYDQEWQTTPSYRFIGVCPDDPSTVGVLLEMQAQFGILYKDKDGKTRCRIAKLAPQPIVATTASTTDEKVMCVTPRNASRPALLLPPWRLKRRNGRQGSSSHSTSTSASSSSTSLILSELAFTYCDNMTRSMGVYLSTSGNSDDGDWQLQMTWRRKPEHYEVGEVGWSSVGAHMGALSGTFSLTDIKLKYNLRGFDGVHPAIADKELVALIANTSRFRARAGDHYQCASDRHVVLRTPPPRILTPGPPEHPPHNHTIPSNTGGSGNYSADSPEEVHVTLTTRHLRLQSFSDDDQNHFTGAGVTCGVDIHEDHSVTIGIGISVCVVVVISIIGIILTRLYDRDKELQAYEQEYWNMTNRTLSNQGNRHALKSDNDLDGVSPA